jgi:hypothetical protein
MSDGRGERRRIAVQVTGDALLHLSSKRGRGPDDFVARSGDPIHRTAAKTKRMRPKARSQNCPDVSQFITWLSSPFGCSVVGSFPEHPAMTAASPKHHEGRHDSSAALPDL